MKKLAATLALLLSVSVLHAQAPAPAAPAKPAAPAAKTPAKKEVKKEELPKIPGINIARPNGTWLGLEVVDTKFKLSFYDAKKKLMPMDVTRATARWPNPRSPGNNFTVLNGSGSALFGVKPVLPPFVFNVYLTLLRGEGDDAQAVENYTVQFRN
jgi:hypothetical protein